MEWRVTAYLLATRRCARARARTAGAGVKWHRVRGHSAYLGSRVHRASLPARLGGRTRRIAIT